MTMHAAKGLEADVVFVYGGFGPAPNDTRAQLRRRRPPAAPRGPPAAARDHRAGQARARRRGPAPLLRRADARAQAAVPAVFGQCPREEDASPFDTPPEEYWRLAGGYRHVNRRLRELRHRAGHAPPARSARDSRSTRATATTSARAPPPALAAWRPDPGRRRADRRPTRRLAALRRARAGAVTTSYSRIKQAHGGYRPPTEMLDEVAAPRRRPRRRRRRRRAARAARAPASSCTRCWRSCRWRRCARRRRSTPGARATTCARCRRAAAAPARTRRRRPRPGACGWRTRR